jgi:hypothetical protein
VEAVVMMVTVTAVVVVMALVVVVLRQQPGRAGLPAALRRIVRSAAP